MAAVKIDKEILDRLANKMGDMNNDVVQLSSAGFDLSAQCARHWLHGMIYVLGELGYCVETEGTSKVRVFERRNAE